MPDIETSTGRDKCARPRWDEQDEQAHIEDSIRSGEMEQLELFDKATKKAEDKRPMRIVEIDSHDIVQWQDHRGGWWTCTNAKNGLDNDFAVFLSLVPQAKARKFAGDDVPVVSTDKKPVQRGTTWSYGTEGDWVKEWYVDEEDQDAKSYYQALRELARSVE